MTQALHIAGKQHKSKLSIRLTQALLYYGRQYAVAAFAVMSMMLPVAAYADESQYTIPTSFAVDHMGSATVNVPLTLPPGLHGMVPNLALSYSSSNGNGYVGMGWSLSGISSITRCPHTVATNGVALPVTFTSGDVFCFQGAPMVQAQQQTAVGQAPSQGQQFSPGEQLVLTSGSYGANGSIYTTEIENFAQIISNATSSSNGPVAFTVYTRSGLIYEYGATGGSAVLCQTASCTANGQTTVMTWMLDKITDTLGNTINIIYQQDSGRAYPSQITYGSNIGQNQAPSVSVNFSYITTRADHPIQFLAGQQLQTNWLLSSIVTSEGAVGASGATNAVTTYNLTYKSGLTGRSQLASVSRVGYLGQQVLLSKIFNYCDQCGASADLLNFFDDAANNNGIFASLGLGSNISYALTNQSSVYGFWLGGSSAAYPTQNLVTPRYVVSAVNADNGLGGYYAVNYNYWNGLRDLTGRGFLGFASVWATDPQMGLLKSTVYSQAYPTIGDVTGADVYYDNGSIAVKTVATTYSMAPAYNAPSGTTCPAISFTTPVTRCFPYVSQTVTSGNDLSGQPMPTTTQTFTNPDGYGNIWDIATATTTQTATGATPQASFSSYEADTYENNPAGWSATNGYNWILGLKTTSQATSENYVVPSGASPTQIVRTIADQYNIYTGQLTQKTVQPNGGTGVQLQTNYSYDAFGNPTTTAATGTSQTLSSLTQTRTACAYSGSSPSTCGTPASWVTPPAISDANHLFPDVVANALGQPTYTNYGPRFGQINAQMDKDGRTSTYGYDDVGRETNETQPDGSTITISYQFCSGVNNGTLTNCPSGAAVGITKTYVGAAGASSGNANQIAPTTITFYNFINQEIATYTEMYNGQWSEVYKWYNNKLQLSQQSQPFVAGTSTYQVISYQYDALNRVTQTNYPDASWDTVLYSQTNKLLYTGITASFAGEPNWKWYDPHGNLTESVQYLTVNGTSTPVSTNYYYDGFNDQTEVIDNSGNKTLYGYDVLGRKISITDPDAGTRAQTYTSFGELQSVVDTKGTTAWMQYDALSRMTTRCWTPAGSGATNTAAVQTCTGQSAPAVYETWSYDPQYGIGEAAGETSTQGAGYSVAHTYFSTSAQNVTGQAGGLLGEPATSTEIIGTKTFNYNYDYDSDNRPSFYGSPSGTVPFTTFNQYTGAVSGLAEDHTGSSLAGIWAANSYDAWGHLTQETYGNNISTQYTYDPYLGRLTNLVTKDPTGVYSLQNVAYTWDQLDNLTNRNDSVNALNETYSYDTLNRLTQITLPNSSNAVENSFTYDLLGDMLTKGDVGTYSYPTAGSQQPHAVTSVTTTGGVTGAFAYDANGNLTGETSLTAAKPKVVLDAKGQVVSGVSASTRTIGWTLFDMPATLSAAGHSFVYQYDADHNRVMQTEDTGSATYYLPDGELTPDGNYHTYLEVGGERVAEVYGATAAALAHHYFHNDYQNSIGLITTDNYVYGKAASTAENEASDVFGQPRNPNGTADPTWGANDVSKRRYINQEDITDAQLINLNARLYDPFIGKFLSPDPLIGNQDDSQAWNAYSYSKNNPMSLSDPTGRNPAAIAGVAAIEIFGFPEAEIGTGIVLVGAGIGSVAVGVKIGTAIHDHRSSPSGLGSQAVTSKPVVHPNSEDGGHAVPPQAGSHPAPSGEGAIKPHDEEGCVYCVPGSHTSSGKDYIGRSDKMADRAKVTKDGRDRSAAEKVGSYKAGDRSAGRTAEQKAMNDRGGVQKLDNKRNEIAPNKWEPAGVKPPSSPSDVAPKSPPPPPRSTGQ